MEIKMRRLTYLIVAGILFIQDIQAQNNNPFVSAQPNATKEELDAIDKVKDEIKNNISAYRKEEKYKDSTGYRNLYFNGKELKLIAVLYKDTNTEKNVEWYFQNEKMIFSWQVWRDVKTKDTLDYERFYLSNERLIAWFKFDKQVDHNTVVFKKLNYRMRDYIDDLKRENPRLAK